MLITGGGVETTLIFHRGIELPHFASFEVLKDEAGLEALRSYEVPFLELARRHRVGAIIDTVTWRANEDWATLLGYSREGLAEVIRKAVEFARGLKAEYETEDTPILISGCLGPRDDDYDPHTLMSADAAERYHALEIGMFADVGVDLLAALTLTYPAEAIGFVRAAERAGIPISISFTVETDGRLPTGRELREAIEEVDAETDGAAAYFMVNCAHPSHFSAVLDDGGAWRQRIHGVRPNASKKSHEELDASDDLDEGDPAEWGADYAALGPLLPNLSLVGGCCGTDHRHVGEAFARLLDQGTGARPAPPAPTHEG